MVGMRHVSSKLDQYGFHRHIAGPGRKAWEFSGVNLDQDIGSALALKQDVCQERSVYKLY